MNLNKTIIAGRLTHDIELRYTPSGTTVANLNLAINRHYTTKDGEKKEEVTFVKVVVWGKTAEIVNQYSNKGSLLLIEGKLQTRSWEDNNGNKRSVMEVRADNVQFIGNGQKSESPEKTGKGDYPSEMM